MLVIVKRAFLIAGKRQEPGREIEVGDAFARALIHNGQAAAVEHAAAAQAGPMTTETTPEIVPGKKKGKDK